MRSEEITKAWTADDLGILNPLDVQKGSVTLDNPEIEAAVKAYNDHVISMNIMKKRFNKKFYIMVVFNIIMHCLCSLSVILLPFLNESESEDAVSRVLLYRWTGNAPLCVLVWVVAIILFAYIVFVKKRLSLAVAVPISLVLCTIDMLYIILCIFNAAECFELKPVYDELSNDVGFPGFNDIKGFAPSFGAEKYKEGYSRGNGGLEDI